VTGGEKLSVIFAAFFPHELRDEILFAKGLVHGRAQTVHFVVVDRDQDNSVVREKLSQHSESWPHHAKPLVVPGEVLAVNYFAEPFLNHWRTDVVVVDPTFVAGVVGWVDIYALHLAVIVGQQGFERLQIIAMDHQVIVQTHLVGEAFRLQRLQFVVRHEQMKILHQRFAFEIYGWHAPIIAPPMPTTQGSSPVDCCGAGALTHQVAEFMQYWVLQI
jgi:hypothetical protein